MILGLAWGGAGLELFDPEEGGAGHGDWHCEEIDDWDAGHDHDRAAEAE